MSMLQCFFEKIYGDEPSKLGLFDGLQITQHPEIMAQQGQYPVIAMTLKFSDAPNWPNSYEKIKKVIANEFKRHSYILESDVCSTREKQNFLDIIDGIASETIYQSSLELLTKYLFQYHKQRPILLIDEYDVPIHAGFLYKYYDQVVNFMRPFLGDGMKNNNALHFAVMTGCLRVAKESIFTGLNNLEVCSFLNHQYSDKFGLTEEEVLKILTFYNIASEVENVRSWYNGYTCGDKKVYNPWSIINLVKQNGKLQPYWINTSTNSIVKQLLQNGDDKVKQDLEILIAGGAITKEIQESIVYADVANNSNSLWNFLLFSGYLTFKNERLVEEFIYADFYVPNKEIMYLFKSTIMSWFASQSMSSNYNEMLEFLVAGDITNFAGLFSAFVVDAFSFFDTSGKQPEKFYHAFVLGMLTSLSSRYEIKSNRKSGYGRYDVMLVPKDLQKIGIILEFKKEDAFTNQTLEQAAHNALTQIEAKKYAQEMQSRGVARVVPIAIAFAGKQVLVLSV